MINYLGIVLPIILVIIAFLLKLFMDRSATVPLVIRSLYELPVDIIFLAISFSIAVAISQKGKRDEGLLFAFMFLVAVLFSVVFWRRSILLFERHHNIWSSIVFIFNISLAALCLANGISILIGA